LNREDFRGTGNKIIDTIMQFANSFKEFEKIGEKIKAATVLLVTKVDK
jgi:hypothetical protein